MHLLVQLSIGTFAPKNTVVEHLWAVVCSIASKGGRFMAILKVEAQGGRYENVDTLAVERKGIKKKAMHTLDKFAHPDEVSVQVQSFACTQ